MFARSLFNTRPAFLARSRTGCNLTNMNMDLSWQAGGTGPVRGTHYPQFTSTLLNWLQASKVGAVRLMVTWEALQSSLGGPVPATASGSGFSNYWTDLKSTLTGLLSRGIHVVICPWQFNPTTNDTDITYNGVAFTSTNFADFWGKFATAINAVTGNDPRVAFDLINEPHLQSEGPAGGVGITLANWFACAQAAITSIRNTGATNWIGVSGMTYTDSASFVSNGSAAKFLTLSDPGKKLYVTVHNYNQFNAHSTSSTALSSAMTSLVSWARTNGVKVRIDEIACDDNANGVTTAQANAFWADWVSYCATNSDVVAGWCWWGQSESGWWDAADFHWGLSLDDGSTTTKFFTLISSALSG